MCFSIVALVMLLLSIVFAPLSIILVETCEVFENFLTNKEDFNAYNKIIDEEMKKKFEVCLFGNGNLVSELGLDS